MRFFLRTLGTVWYIFLALCILTMWLTIGYFFFTLEKHGFHHG